MAEQNDLSDLSLKSMNHLFGVSDPFCRLGSTSAISSSEKPIAPDMSIKITSRKVELTLTTLALHEGLSG
jgi:hypothetical protein